jgi:hypothetical protein
MMSETFVSNQVVYIPSQKSDRICRKNVANGAWSSTMLNSIPGAHHSELFHSLDSFSLRRIQMFIRDAFRAAHEANIEMDSLKAVRYDRVHTREEWRALTFAAFMVYS